MKKWSTYDVKRAEYGDFAVEESYKELRKHKIMFKSSKDYFDTWSHHLDKLFGDIVIFIGEKKYYCDIKRNSVSIDSINGFIGDYFIVYHDSLNKNFIIPAGHLKLCQDQYFKERLLSGDLGIKFRNFYDKKFLSLEEWILKTLSENYTKNNIIQF